jgi:hypothetical protein
VPGGGQAGEIAALPPQIHHAAMLDYRLPWINLLSREEDRCHFQQGQIAIDAQRIRDAVA